MSETTSETATLDFERVAQAARLVAPVSSGSIRNRRMAPPPPPPPFVLAAAATTPPAVAAHSPSIPDAVSLRAWEEAAVQLEADWATPVYDDDEVAEHTEPLEPEASAEPSVDAPKLPLIVIEDSQPEPAAAKPNADAEATPATDVPQPSKPDQTTSEAGAAVESAAATDDDASEQTNPSTPEAIDESASVPEETELEALARSVTKSALDALAVRAQAPARPLPPPPPRPQSLLSTFAPPAVTRTPLPPPVATRAPLPPLAPPPASRSLPPLAPPVSSRSLPTRPPPAPALRSQPVPPPAPRSSASPIAASTRARMETMPSIAKLALPPQNTAPSLLEIRRSPIARRFYAQLGVAAVIGALLATVLFAAIAKQGSPPPTTAVSQAAEPPAANTAVRVPETRPEPRVETTAVADSIPPPPITSLSIDDLEREPAKTLKSTPKTGVGTPAPAAPSPAVAATPAPPAAAKPEAAAVASATKGTLHINAVPAANVAIDGRPLGMTPKIVRLSPGTHRVALIGPSGRRSQIVNVAAGKTAAVSVKF